MAFGVVLVAVAVMLASAALVGLYMAFRGGMDAQVHG
jgi:hypothetical protein